MAFSRGDIIEIYFKLPYDKKQECHPGVIISNEDVFLDDGCYIVAMITSSEKTDIYSYSIEDNMLNKALHKKSQVRCHLIAHVLPEYILGGKILATMKKPYVDIIVQRIYDNVLTEQ